MTDESLHRGEHTMKKSFAAAAAAVVLTLSATGCSSAASQTAAPVAPKKNATPAATVASTTEAILVDAAGKTGIAKSEVTLVAVESVVWADGSLGCPAPGMSYTMAQVAGYRMHVRAGKRELDYHADQRGHFLLCPEGRASDPVGPVAY